MSTEHEIVSVPLNIWPVASLSQGTISGLWSLNHSVQQSSMRRGALIIKRCFFINGAKLSWDLLQEGQCTRWSKSLQRTCAITSTFIVNYISPANEVLTNYKGWCIFYCSFGQDLHHEPMKTELGKQHGFGLLISGNIHKAWGNHQRVIFQTQRGQCPGINV